MTTKSTKSSKRPSIVGALLARNEAGRYLKEVLENALSFCGEVVVLDDGSTDETAEIAEAAGCYVQHRGDCIGGFWGGDESTPRAQLWDLAAARAGPGGWVYVFDSDHLLEGITPDAFKCLCSASQAEGWAFRLYDLWGARGVHRVDSFWQAWRMPRVWLARVPLSEGFAPEWKAVRGIHTGHFPANLLLGEVGVVPGLAAIHHLGYVSEVDREAKAAKYLDLGLAFCETSR